MTINNVKNIVVENYNKIHIFRFNGSRNHIEEFEGRIVEIYPAIFIIKLEDDKVRSFSYNDLLINNLEIIG